MPITVTPYIPRYITVHTGPASAAAENITVTFPDYIKNVASSEIFPTWNEQALRANILAQVSFALNRVYTEYYRSRGYNFDITGSTINDQKFTKGRNTFENVDKLVDELFNTYVRRKGFVEPLSTRFCNGTTVTCEGLSQWGSQELARQGLNYVQILRRYYGDDIELVPNAPIRNISRSYPGYPLRQGSSGEEVVAIQFMLNRIGYNYPAIPRVDPVDGIFGSQTLDAVKTFQSVFNLTPDGVVGEATWYKIVFLYVGVTNLSELVSEGQRYYNVQYGPNIPQLREGAQGYPVSALQFFLAVVGEYNYAVPSPAIDGVFGPETRASVEAFQRQMGLNVDGVAGTQTWNRLFSEYQGIARTSLAYANLPLTPEQFEGQAGQFPGGALSYRSAD